VEWRQKSLRILPVKTFFFLTKKKNEEGHLYDMYVPVFVVGDDSYEAEGMRNAIGMLHSINVTYVTCPTTSHAQEPKRLLTKKIAVKSMQP
jgi:hypothetical protein